ncbi:MAG: glycerophosphodiester phosphodiesterase [Azospirillum brasilense]|nr:MAG: glycerophosphodiester phosphodiesterase [Azospirillum brasilense]
MTKIIGHRGGAFLWPENSIGGFLRSLQLKVEYCECDIHLSVDKQPIVHHDARLERTSEGQGLLADHPAEELTRLRLRGAGGECIPHLRDVVELVASSTSGLQVELKTDVRGRPYPGLLDAALPILDRHGMRGRCGIIAFHAPTAAAAQVAGGFDHVAWLFDPAMLEGLGLPGVIGVAKAHGLSMVEAHASVMDAELVAGLRAAGLRIAVWGGNHADSITRMLDLGVDALASDDPVLAMRMRG